MTAELLLYALIAGGLIFWLYNILGTRSDDDLERPSKFSFDESADKLLGGEEKQSKNNIVSLNELTGAAGFILPRNVRIDNKTTENFLQDFVKDNTTVDISHFAQNLENAFVMIIEAYADGDLDTLEMLLAHTVFEAFNGAIEEREKRGERVETQVKSVEKIDIIGAELADNDFNMTVRFTAREICVIRDKDGNITSGAEEKVTEMVDVWVFSKDISSDGPEWYLVETRDDEVEDHKTPVPDTSN